MVESTFRVTLAEGQDISNRARENIYRLLDERGISVRRGLKALKFRGLYNFLSSRSDITVTRLQRVAEELGVSFEEIIKET
jgi:transcriptional regulator with XRE-family HTH domain